MFLTRSENQFNFSKLITACYCTTGAMNNITTIIPCSECRNCHFMEGHTMHFQNFMQFFFKEKGAFLIWEFSTSVTFEAVVAFNMT